MPTPARCSPNSTRGTPIAARGRLADFQLTDAQLVVARQYGFPSWPRLREYVQTVQRYARNPQDQPVGAAVHSRDEAIAEFLRLACLNYGTNEPARLQQARDMLAADPSLAGATIHTAAAVGDLAATQRILAADPTQANAVGGPYDWEPLLYATYSRLDITEPATLDARRRPIPARPRC